MSNKEKISSLIESSGLNDERKGLLYKSFDDFIATAQEWESKAKEIVVTDISQVEIMKTAREGRLLLREKRTDIERLRKQIKEQPLRECQAIDAVARTLTELITPIEEYLKHQEEFAKREKDKLAQERKSLLESFGATSDGLDLVEMTESMFNMILAGAKSEHEALLKKQEEERLKKEEEAKKEKKRLEEQEAENERLRKLAKEQADKLAEEQNKLKEIQRKAEEEKAKLQAQQDAKLKAEQDKLKAEKDKLKEIQRKAEEETAKLKAEQDAKIKEMRDKLAQAEKEKEGVIFFIVNKNSIKRTYESVEQAKNALAQASATMSVEDFVICQVMK